MLNDKGEEVGIIYGWYCTVTDKWYIGQTVNPEDRFKNHINDAINKKDNIKFHNALRKYGLDKFVYCVLEENVLRDNLNMREIEWIEYYDSFYSGYNLTLGGDGITGYWRGKHHSMKSRIKMSESVKGIKNHNYNKPRTEETRQKISNKLKGRTFSPESRIKMSESRKGKRMSEDTKKKLSDIFKGIRNPMHGKHHSIESIMKMRESRKKKVNKYDLNGNYIQTYNSLKEATRQNPKSGTNISSACKGRIKQAGGFIWKYAH